ncbi:MAG: thioether cross-link-forming SCIFF peptide maturase [Firmicutes bacterium]|nr:thioether cross-link-forming SCIFF peptide maturase [Bacillota bacterium]
MVYTFKMLDRHFAFDVNSGSAFEINSLTSLLIENKNLLLNKTEEGFLDLKIKQIQDQISLFPPDQTKSALAEIDQLIDEGVLFSKDLSVQMPNFSGQVKALCLNITHKCNLKCAYCFAGGGGYDGNYGAEQADKSQNLSQHMTIEQSKAAVDFLIKKSGNRKNLEIDFFGGEPLLNFDTVKKTVAYAKKIENEQGKNFKFTITTNAYALTDDHIDFFNKQMDNVVISIDGRQCTHDQARPDTKNNPTYQKTVKNALNFVHKRKSNPDKSKRLYYIRGTFTSQNMDFATDCLHLADLGFDQISLEPVVLPLNNPLALTDDHLQTLKDQYEILLTEILKRNNTDRHFDFFHFNIDLKGGPCLKKRLSGCGVGGEYLCISPRGSIYPCHRFDNDKKYLMGNVLHQANDQKIESIKSSIVSYFSSSNLLTKKHCQDCFAKFLCSGGCAANNIEYGGHIDGLHKVSCELMKKRAECAIVLAIDLIQ